MASTPSIPSFQYRVSVWLKACFGYKPEIITDVIERCHRLTEESLELAQSLGMSKEDALYLVDYVYGRPKGDPPQEVGGTIITLAALCHAVGTINMMKAGEQELNRCWANIDKIRAKQATKPKHSPLAEK